MRPARRPARSNKFVPLLIWAVLGIGLVAHAQTAERGAPPQLQTRQLQNGLQTVYVQDTTRRLCHIGLTLRGGASLNPPDGAGLAHFFAHYFFGDLDSASLSHSRVLSGWGHGGLPPSTPALSFHLTRNTYREHHTFTLSASPGQVGASMGAMANALLTLFEHPLHKEAILSAIATELESRTTDPAHALMAELQDRFWPDAWRAKQHVLGNYADLVDATLETLVRHVGPEIVPENCLLSATGPEPAEAFFALADSLLGQWYVPTSAAGNPNSPELLGFKGLRESIYFVTVSEFATQPLLMMAWPVPAARDGWASAKAAADFAKVARMRAGPFHRALTATGKADALWWEYQGGHGPGLLLLGIVPHPDSIPACRTAVDAVLDEIAHSPLAMEKGDAMVAAARMDALANGLDWDQSPRRLDILGHRWAIYDPDWATSSPAELTESALLSKFAADVLRNKPHVAGLLINSSLDEAFLAGQAFSPAIADTPGPGFDISELLQPTTEFYWPHVQLPFYRIYFKPNSFEPDLASTEVLKEVAAILAAEPDLKIYVNGYADSQGDGVKNYHLSIRRAQAVQKFLAQAYGIAEDRLILQPFGEAFPEFPETTPELRAKNRRVTFEIAPPDAQPRHFVF